MSLSEIVSREMGELLGYARVSAADQDPSLQVDALEVAGCSRLFTDHASGALDEPPESAERHDAGQDRHRSQDARYR